MGLIAEQLLMATGLTEAPDRTAVVASRGVLRLVEQDLTAVLDHDDPRPFRAIATKPTYIDRLAKSPDYATWIEGLEDQIGLDVAAAYQLLHQTARQYVLSRYPGSQLTGIVGAIPAPPGVIELTRGRLLADTIENQRIGYDVTSAGLLPANVEAFKVCFPVSYAALADALRTALNNRASKAPGKWRPLWWQDQVIRTFLQAPPKAAAPAPKAPEAPASSKAKLNTEQLEPVEGL
jgi:hypothetical protein